MAGKFYAPVRAPKAEPAKYGLINSKTVVTDADRWEAGIDLDSVLCNVNLNNVEICDPSNEINILEPADTSNQNIPFVVEAEFSCSTFGFESSDYRQKALDAMDLVQSMAVEHEFWTGELAAMDTTTDGGNPNRSLDSGTAEVVNPTVGTAVSVEYGIALLEGAIARSGSYRGFIHGSRATIAVIADDLDNKGDVLKTSLGNYVIAGSGYTGSGTGVTDDTNNLAWIYATGPVGVYLSDIDVVPDNLSEAVDTRVNTVTFRAQRTAAVVWDGCAHYGVLVDLSK